MLYDIYIKLEILKKLIWLNKKYQVLVLGLLLFNFLFVNLKVLKGL